MIQLARIITNQVVQAYKDALARRGYNPFIQVKVPQGGALEKNCIAFFNIARDRKLALVDLMMCATKTYGEEFCLTVTKRPYPPFNWVVSPKLHEGLKYKLKDVKVVKGNIKRIVNDYMQVLSSMPVRDAIETVKNGWPEGSKEVRTEILRRLKDGNQIPA